MSWNSTRESSDSRIPAWQVGEAEGALGWRLSVLGHRQEAQRLLQQSQNKLVPDPRPIYRKQGERTYEGACRRQNNSTAVRIERKTSPS
jgi:hypothetical protein